MMYNLIKKENGITLIALVVTIVILIILAAVSMTMVLGNNGIFEQAKKGANSMASAETNTQAGFNSMSAEIDKIISGNGGSQNPEQPKETIENAKDTGKEFTDDKTTVEDSKGNKVVIPGGFIVAPDSGDTVEQGIVIEDVSASKDENVKGSQFVWIPVGTFVKDDGTTSKEIVLGRYTFNQNDGARTLVQAAYTKENEKNYEQEIELKEYGTSYKEILIHRDGIESNKLDGLNATAQNLKAFVESAKTNGGYYIGRYESSYASGDNTEEFKAASKKSTAYSENRMSYITGTLWNNITQISASKVSINTYSAATTVKSDLMNSYAWGTALAYIQETGHVNYVNEKSKNKSLSNTGTNGDEVCKINDISSNIGEWTTEYTNVNDGSSVYPCCRRGAYYSSTLSYTSHPRKC